MEKNIMAALAAVVIVEVALAAGVVYAVTDDGSDEGTDSVYTLYIGMQDSETHVEYDPDVVDDTIDAIVLKYAGGLTRYQAMGAYTYDDGTKATETSLVYVLADISLEDVHKIADEVKEALNQESVMITVSENTVEFY